MQRAITTAEIPLHSRGPARWREQEQQQAAEPAGEAVDADIDEGLDAVPQLLRQRHVEQLHAGAIEGIAGGGFGEPDGGGGRHAVDASTVAIDAATMHAGRDLQGSAHSEAAHDHRVTKS